MSFPNGLKNYLLANFERSGIGNETSAIRIAVLGNIPIKFKKNGRKILSSSIDRKSKSGSRKNGENVYQKSEGLQN